MKTIKNIINVIISPVILISLGFIIGCIDYKLELGINRYVPFIFIISGVISFVVRRILFIEK